MELQPVDRLGRCLRPGFLTDPGKMNLDRLLGELERKRSFLDRDVLEVCH